MVFQHKLLTAIHKHYSVEDWKEFAKDNAKVLPVSSKFCSPNKSQQNISLEITQPSNFCQSEKQKWAMQDTSLTAQYIS